MSDMLMELMAVAETVPKDAPESDFAFPPHGLYIGDANHAHLAVQAITSGLEGNVAKIPADKMATVKAKIHAAIAKFYHGDEAKYYETWLSTGKKPDDKPAAEMHVSEIRLSTPDFAFKGKPPNVPLAPGVDYDALIAMTCPACHGDGCPKCDKKGTIPDPSPLFVIRPLGVLGAISENNLKYDQELLDEIRMAVIQKKPAGRQGHVSEENSSWEFPDDVSLWVGAAQHGDTLFGKAFIYRDTPFYEMVKKRKAAGSTLSNSIWGKGHFEPNSDGTQRLRGLNLETIDFAPAERAALQQLGGQFQTTSEMTDETKGVPPMADQHDDKEQDLALIRGEIAKMAPHALHEMMTAEQRKHVTETHLREMEPASVYEMMPLDHKKSCAECYAKEFGQKPTAEMGNANTAEMTTLKKSVAEMQSMIAEYRQRDFDMALDKAAAKPFSTWNVNKPENKKAIVGAQGNFAMYIVAEMATMQGGQKIENIEKAAESAWPKYEPQAALLKIAVTGGNVITGEGVVSEQTSNNKWGWDEATQSYTKEAVDRNRSITNQQGVH